MNDDEESPDDYESDQVATLVELRELRAENAALREIVEAVANHDSDMLCYHDGWGSSCIFCSGSEIAVPPYTFTHDPDCPVTKAHALLGKSPEEQKQ